MKIDNKKIKELFRYRNISFLLDKLPEEKATSLLKQLYQLQRAIYALDHYLETNWYLKDEELRKFWGSIYQVLTQIGYSKDQSYSLCAHIRRYQLHETQLREGKRPGRLSMEYFYYYKSCDVRLLRQIIIDQDPDLFKARQLSNWRYFDLVTEVNDDIEDVFEDIRTINANAFLISINESSIARTRKEFKNFLKMVLEKSELRSKRVSTAENKLIHDWTLKNIRSTSKLLENTLKELSRGKIKTKSMLDFHAKNK